MSPGGRPLESTKEIEMKCNPGAALVLLAATTAPLVAQQHFPSNEDLRHVRGISAPQLSPDLKHVLTIVQDSTAEGGASHLWLLNVDGSAPRQLTFSQTPTPAAAGPATGAEAGARRSGGPGERSAEYLPDGSAILFIAKRGEKSQLFRLPLDGGEAAPIKLEHPPAGGGPAAMVDVTSYTIAPDGKTIAIIATDPQSAARTRDVRDQKDVVWVEHDEPEHRLYLMDTATWKDREVPALKDMDSVAWSEDSARLVVLTHAKLRDLGPSAIGTIVSAANPSEQAAVASLPISARRVAWLHSGKGFVLFAKCEIDTPEGCADLFSFDIATGKLHNVTGGLKDSTLSPGTLTIADDDKTAVVALNHGMHETVGQVDLTTGAIKLYDLGLPVISGFRADPKNQAWVYVASSSTVPPSVHMTSSPTQPGKRLVQPELVPAEWTSVPSKPMSWKRAGFTIEGLLYLPPQAASGKVPMVVNVHGGPRGQFTDAYSPLTSLLLGQGWAVLVTNPRGSTGYGASFEAANKNDMGNGDYLDIMMGVDEAIRSAPIDGDKLALIGYSYGGEMAAFVEGKTTRFKAIVSGAPVIDQFSEYGTESGSYGDRWYTGMPWRNFESAWRQSPLAYAQHAKTPFLLLQGQSDTTDPEGQSKEMYRALRQEGVPVQMLLFPREDHGALGGNFAGRPSTEPWHGIIAREHMLKFIADGFAGKIQPNKP
jgi:dipeptidyl aminopeptidase/acylaminoacyl peptidase